MRKLMRGLAVATALSLAPLAAVAITSAPAQAAAVVTTKVTFNSGIKKTGFSGDYLSITADVTAVNDPDGYDSPFVGAAYLQRRAPGSSVWKNVGVDTSPGFSYFPNYDKYNGNASFRVYYTGGVYSPGQSNERTYPASVSPVLKLNTARNIDIRDLPGRNAKLKITVKPKFGKKKLIVQTKKRGKFRTTGRLRTNKRGVAVKVFAGSRGGIRYRVIAPGNRDYVGSTYTFRVTRY